MGRYFVNTIWHWIWNILLLLEMEKDGSIAVSLHCSIFPIYIQPTLVSLYLNIESIAKGLPGSWNVLNLIRKAYVGLFKHVFWCKPMKVSEIMRWPVRRLFVFNHWDCLPTTSRTNKGESSLIIFNICTFLFLGLVCKSTEFQLNYWCSQGNSDHKMFKCNILLRIFDIDNQDINLDRLFTQSGNSNRSLNIYLRKSYHKIDQNLWEICRCREMSIGQVHFTKKKRRYM